MLPFSVFNAMGEGFLTGLHIECRIMCKKRGIWMNFRRKHRDRRINR